MRELGSEMYPTPKHFTCEWTEQHDDMYPEFAPEPIVIECHAEATVVIAYWDMPPWGFGLPVAAQYCATHAAMWEADNAAAAHCPAVEHVCLDRPVAAPVVRTVAPAVFWDPGDGIWREQATGNPVPDPVARDRAETDPCERGTVGCSLHHSAEGAEPCTTW